MASMSFKEKMAMFNKKSSPSQTNIVKKKSSPKLARRLSQLGKKLPVDDKKKDGGANRPAPQRVMPKRLPQPIRVKPPVKEGRARANPVMTRTQSMPAVVKMKVTQPNSNNDGDNNNNNNNNDNSVNTIKGEEEGDKGNKKKVEADIKKIEKTTPPLTKKKSHGRVKSGGSVIAALQNKLKLSSPSGQFSPTPLSPFGGGGLKSTHSMSRMKSNTVTEKVNNDNSLLIKSDSFRHTASDKHKNIGEIKHEKRIVLKKKRRPRTKMKKINF